MRAYQVLIPGTWRDGALVSSNSIGSIAHSFLDALEHIAPSKILSPNALQRSYSTSSQNLGSLEQLLRNWESEAQVSRDL